jgi:tRNA nucleotidyltransferase (CCA-adding enzyme)
MQKSDAQVYLVGGAVRDELMGRAVSDRDFVVVGATTGDMQAMGYRQVGADFPVFLHPVTGEEYALARKEFKNGVGYHGFEVDASADVTLEEDLARRDLTVNAMARTEDGTLVDPYGGKKDLEDKVFRHVGPNFSEDPVRVLRVARFMARHAHEGWTVAPETQDLMTKMCQSGELESLTPERVWKELSRALCEPTPSAFVKTLKACEGLAAILPEVDALFGVPQPKVHHPEIDTGIHTMLVMDQSAHLSNRLEVRFGAMVHDLGKGLTPLEMLPRHIGHEKAGIPLVEALCERLKAPTSVLRAGRTASDLHLKVHQAMAMTPKNITEFMTALRVKTNPALLEDLLLISEADARGRTGKENDRYHQADYLRAMAKKFCQFNATDVARKFAGNGERISTEIKRAQTKNLAIEKSRLLAGRESPSPS